MTFWKCVVVLVLCVVNSLGLASTLTTSADLQDGVLEMVIQLKIELEEVTRRISLLEEENQSMKKENEVMKIENEVMKKRIEQLEVTNAALIENIKLKADSSENVEKSEFFNDLEHTSNSTLSRRQQKRILIPGSMNPFDTPVAFSAVLTHDLPLGPLQTIDYDKVITNIGNAFDARHGRFTSPLNGIYLFAATIHSQSNQSVHAEIVVNGVQKAAMYGDDYDLCSQTIIAVLKRGDSVWVRHFSESISSVHSGSDRYYNSFSGFLIRYLQ